MTKEDIIEMARRAEFVNLDLCSSELKRFANLVAQHEREVVANWIMDRGFATGHGDSMVDLLDQLEWQIAEKEREACAKICEPQEEHDDPLTAWKISEAIRARGEA